jgi:hypothetical protein
LKIPSGRCSGRWSASLLVTIWAKSLVPGNPFLVGSGSRARSLRARRRPGRRGRVSGSKLGETAIRRRSSWVRTRESSGAAAGVGAIGSKRATGRSRGVPAGNGAAGEGSSAAGEVEAPRRP